MRAAQYLRMSTEQQKYSAEYQAAAIAEYAAARDCQIVRTYEDLGISGLQLKNRPGLKQLLSDVVGGEADFELVIVYDVSRWGRFQDPDQSAHYEFLCREAGVRVEYCAEPFENDGSALTTLVKGLKRVMAAEYSRELGMKVYAGQQLLAGKGYWQGGMPGLGFRRMVVEEDGSQGRILELGKQKGGRTERTAIVLGPDDEITLVRRIYSMFVSERMPIKAIARQLNAEGLRNPIGRPWGYMPLRRILSDEMYIGTLVFGQTSARAGQPPRRQPSSTWLRVRNAIPAIVDEEIFRRAAQRRLEGGKRRVARAAMLERLRRLERDVSPPDGPVESARKVELQGDLAKVPWGPARKGGERLIEAFRPRLHEILAEREALLETNRCSMRDVWRRLQAEGFEGGYDLVVRASYLWRRRWQAMTGRPRRCIGLSDEEMLSGLRALFHREGRLSGRLIEAEQDLPSAGHYYTRFGSLMTAYLLVGYEPPATSFQARRWGKMTKRAAAVARR